MTEKPNERTNEIEESISDSEEVKKVVSDSKSTKKDASKKDKKEDKKKKRKIKPTFVVICILVAALIGVLVYFLWPTEEAEIIDGPVPMGGRGIVAVPENIEELMRDRDEPPPGGHYITTMNNTWTFDRWNVASDNAYVENDIRNEYTVYFDLSIEEDGRLVYSSPYIPQGAVLRGFALDRMVPAGDHSAIVTYYLVDENGEEVSRVSVRVTLSISR